MIIKGLQRSTLLQVGIEGALLTLAPAPFILATTMVDAGAPPHWRLIAATISTLACLAAALLLLRRPLAGRFFAVVTVAASAVTVYPFLAADPVAALL
jgi:hypothetical protein